MKNTVNKAWKNIKWKKNRKFKTQNYFEVIENTNYLQFLQKKTYSSFAYTNVLNVESNSSSYTPHINCKKICFQNKNKEPNYLTRKKVLIITNYKNVIYSYLIHCLFHL